MQFIAFAMPCPAALFVLSDRKRLLCSTRRPIPLGIDFGLWEQIGANGVVVVVHVVSVVVDVAVVVDVSGIIVVIAGRTKPNASAVPFFYAPRRGTSERGAVIFSFLLFLVSYVSRIPAVFFRLSSLPVQPASSLRHSLICREQFSYCFSVTAPCSDAKSTM